MARSRNRRAPLWARLGAAAGCLLLVPAAGTVAAIAAVEATSERAGLDGPLNILLVGIDPRGTHVTPLADAIIVAHIPADRQGAYLFSLPRDLVVRIPAFAKNGTPAQRAKINAAMALGSRIGPDRYDPAQGLELLARTVGDVTGIKEFDAGAVINFGGFKRMVATLGGVRMVIDQDVVSEHLQPDGSPREVSPECRESRKCLRPYTGAQKTYRTSAEPVRLRSWEALDYLRQRYGLPRSDYDRQRHQRQFLQAVVRQISRDGALRPARLMKVLTTVGDSLVVDGGGHDITDWIIELKDLHAGSVTAVDLPGEPVFEGGKYLGEQFTSGAAAFFAAVRKDRAGRFLLDHPGFADLDPALAGPPRRP
ncbi:LCP family protein [Actinoplanes sp. NEAU-A12]|uniref:LCP family protein n=1 Tax=Actinoplanes sandaracinus TaxID=3045177 RepID=A0ABT6WKF6_9ACTN|nr:LCP family protein [Actinoplanes sandaracinus]MDI6100206.1 LCP family protein [Actinoplanes sandaracinus]